MTDEDEQLKKAVRSIRADDPAGQLRLDKLAAIEEAWSKYERDSQQFDPLDLMVGVDNDGKLVSGTVLPSGTFVSSRGDEVDISWAAPVRSLLELVQAVGITLTDTESH